MEAPEAPIVKICVLASSSAGNSTFIGTASTRILIDAGLCRRETENRLAAIGESPERLDAILVTARTTVAEAVKFAEDSPWPADREVWEDIYV